MLQKHFILLAACAMLLPAFAQAGPISTDIFYEFGFGIAGDPATGCNPADPAGNFCIPSFGTPTQFLDAPPWTITSPVNLLLTVVDAFTSGDQFAVFDFGAPLGLTSAPGTGADCGDDPVPCLATPEMSQRTYLLLAGGHSITISAALSPDEGGSGYLSVSAVPEPGYVALVAIGCAMLMFFGRRRNQARL